MGNDPRRRLCRSSCSCSNVANAVRPRSTEARFEARIRARRLWSITAKERLQELYFRRILPADLVLLEPAVSEKWAEEFEASAPHMVGDPPGEIRIPDGPNADIEAAENGVYPYEPSQVTTPLFIVYGDYDIVANDPVGSST